MNEFEQWRADRNKALMALDMEWARMKFTTHGATMILTISRNTLSMPRYLQGIG